MIFEVSKSVGGLATELTTSKKSGRSSDITVGMFRSSVWSTMEAWGSGLSLNNCYDYDRTSYAC